MFVSLPHPRKRVNRQLGTVTMLVIPVFGTPAQEDCYKSKAAWAT